MNTIPTEHESAPPLTWASQTSPNEDPGISTWPKWQPAVRARRRSSAIVSLAGRGQRLWLAGAEEALCGGGRRPVALVWRPGRLGLRGEVLAEGDDVPLADGARIVALCGEPGARYVHLAPVADLLSAYGIDAVGGLSWAPERLWLGPVTQPAEKQTSGPEWKARVLRADGHLGVGPLRAQGALPRFLRLHVRITSPRIELRVGRHLDPDDPSVVTIRGATVAPHVYLTGPIGRRAREILGARGRLDARVWMRAELGALVVVSLAVDLRIQRADEETGGGRGAR